MAREKVTTRGKMPADFTDHRFLRSPVEIDHDIAEENDIEDIPEAIVVIHEVERVESNLAAQFRNDSNQRFGLVAAAPYVSPAKFRRHRTDFRLRINTGSRLVQNSGRDVGTQDREVEARPLPRILVQHHRSEEHTSELQSLRHL